MHVDSSLARVLADSLVAADTSVVIVDAVDDSPIVYVNAAFEALTGYPAKDVLGRNCRFLQGRGTDPTTVRTIGQRIRAGQSTRTNLLNYRADGTPFWCELNISAVRDTTAEVVRYIGLQHDVTIEVTHLEDMTRAATVDPLTGLMNRPAFAAQTERELLRSTRHGLTTGVLFLDVDHFKQVNDTHGHATGDAYLAHVGRTLRQHLRGEDTSARHGGDEFTVLLTDLPAGTAAAAGAEKAAQHLRAALGQPFTLDGTRHHPAVTIGQALFPHDATTVAGLISHADADMYRAKPRPAPID